MKRTSLFENISVLSLCVSAILLISLQNPFGWIIIIVGMLTLLLSRRDFAKDIILIYIGLIILALTKISTGFATKDLINIGLGLSGSILVPYIISRYVYKNRVIQFPFFNGRMWSKKEILYLIIAIVVAYFLVPFYFSQTGAHMNWIVETQNYNLYKLFAGISVVGIWDELFFIALILGILTKWYSFWLANIFQAVLFSAFLFKWGFTDWGVLLVFMFAITHGAIFRKNRSLFYMMSIHLCVDFIIFFALLHAHKPDWTSIFLY